MANPSIHASIYLSEANEPFLNTIGGKNNQDPFPNDINNKTKLICRTLTGSLIWGVQVCQRLKLAFS